MVPNTSPFRTRYTVTSGSNLTSGVRCGSQAKASGDLFGDSLEEGDLEIPAFLRRQAN